MCNFFTAISNGKGKVLYFSLKDIEAIEKKGNPQKYEWNSHTSIAHYNEIKGEGEDEWNKWEYDNEKKTLKLDGQMVAGDDTKTVKKEIEKYLAKNNALYCQKVYKRNTGYRNTGYRNTGYMNTGNMNTGYMNTGDMNTGNWNTGYMNTGDMNTGNWNTGDMNTGNWNTGDMNTGYMNTITPEVTIFNKLTEKKRGEISFPDYFYFEINQWVATSEMSDEEKEKYWWYKTTSGYLKNVSYKEAWKQSFEKTTSEDAAKTLQLPNFDYTIFEEITGITQKQLNQKISGGKSE